MCPSAHEAEASRLDACRDGAVRLRLSWRDRLWIAARWTLGLAGTVVVLWIGTAFLAATPAAAAAVVPMATAQGLQKGGTTRLMSADDDGDSDSGDDSDDGDSGDDSDGDSDSHKSEKKEKGSDKKKASKSEDDSDTEDDGSDEQDARSDGEEKDERPEKKDSKDKDSKDKDSKDKDEDSESGDESAREKPDATESASEDADESDAEKPGSSKGKDDDAPADREGDRDSGADDRTAGNGDTDSRPTDAETAGKPGDSDRPSSDGDEDNRDEDDGAGDSATRDRDDDTETAAGSAGDADGDTEDEPTRRDHEGDTTTVGATDDDATEDDAAADDASAGDESGDDDATGGGATADGATDRGDSVRRFAAQTAGSGDITDNGADVSEEQQRDDEEGPAADEDDNRSAADDEDSSARSDEDDSVGGDVSDVATVRAARDGESAAADRAPTGSIRSTELTDSGSRAPPSDSDSETDQVSLLRASEDADADGLRADCDDDCPSEDRADRSRAAADRDDEDGRDDDEDDDDESDDNDSAEHTEKVLEDRLEVDKSADALEETKKKVESGATSKLDYDQQAAEHRKREQDYESERSELSDDRAELIDDVVDGHRDLSDREKELAAAGKDASADEDDEKSRDRDVAEYQERRDDVYEATEELMDATDNTIDAASEDDLDDEGSVSGCGSSGAFTECGAATEDDEGNRDSDRCLSLSGGCSASSKSGDSEASASCDGSGCGSSASGRGDRGEVTRASARCTGECDEQSRAAPDGASAKCASHGGSCASESSGERDDSATTDRAARMVSAGDQERGSSRSAGNGAARCQGGDCATSTSVELDEEGEARSGASVDCGRGCTGSANTDTEAARDGGARTAAALQPATEQAAGDSATSGSARCTAAGGDCTTRSESRTDTDDEGAAGTSAATAEVGCTDGECSGSGSAETDGRIVGVAAVTGGPAPSRDTSASATCQVTAGSCGATSGSEVGEADADRAAESVADGPVAGRELVASSTTNAQVACVDARCAGSGHATTSGAAAGDVPGVRSSTGASDCTVHGAGGGCGATSDTSVSDREPVSERAAVTGPVSVTTANASVTCSGGAGTCGGTTSSATSARDTSVSPHARGTSATADCTVSGGGGCGGETGSAASSAADFVVTDPATGLPVPGQPTSGPSSTSSSSAAVTCLAGVACSGTVHTGTTAWDGAVAGGAPRASAGTASCTGGSAGCEARSMSNASAGPGAALDLSTGQPVNAARFPAGPSAASTAGAATMCAGDVPCTGTASSAASATDPAVSSEPRGSHGDGSCTGVTGGVCQAVTNSGASSDPSAGVLAPQMAESSTANATVSSGTTDEQTPGGAPQNGPAGPDQPAVPPVPTAPGSSVSAGAPTVSGASSWTMAAATLDCAGGTVCAGTARSSASGTDRPNALSGAGAARGPPADGSSTSASCAGGPSACHARTSSTAGSGQVVADILTEDQIDTAQQLAVEAAEAEYDAALAAWVASAPSATAQQKKAAADAATAARQAGSAAQQAAERATKPVTAAPTALARSEATAQCGAAPCRAATSTDAAGSRYGQTRTHAGAQCQAGAAGCATTMSASTVEATTGGVRSDVVEVGSGLDCPAGCTGSLAAGTADQGGNASATCPSACQAGATVSTSVAAVPGGLDRLTSTDAFCAGAGCRTHTDGRAEIADVAGTHTATSRTDCTAATECAGAGSVRVTPLQAEAAAACRAGASGSCRHSFAASSHAASAVAGHSAVADAAGARSGTNGGGQVQTFAQVSTTANGAQAAAGCTGIAECRRSYHAHSEASAGYGSMRATGFADESDARTGEGSGGVATVAGATAGPGGAYAYGFCSGSPGASCRQSGEVFVAPPPPPASTIEVEILDDATTRKAEQTGRDLQAGDRVAGRDAPDNHVRTGYQHSQNTEPRLAAEAADAEAAAYQRAIDAGASPEGAAQIGTHARQTYLDVVAGKVAPGGKAPAAVTRATTGSMAELNVAVQQQAQFAELDAASSAAAAAVNNQQAAPGRDIPDNHLGGVIDHANARAAATLQNARDLAAEATALGRDYALRHGMDPSQAAGFGQDLGAAYVGQINDVPRQVQLRREAVSLAYDVLNGAPAAARAAQAPHNVAATGAPDNVLARAYEHARNGVAPGQAMAADAAGLAAQAGVTGEFANLGEFLDAASVRPVKRGSAAESMNAVLGLMVDDSATADEIAAARTNALYNSDLAVRGEMIESGRPVPEYLHDMRPSQTPLGHLAGVVQLEDDKSEVWDDVFGTAITVLRGEGVGLAPHMTDNQRIHVAEQAAKNARWLTEDTAQRAGDLALQEALMRGWSTEGVQAAAAEAYRTALAGEVVRGESAATRIPGYGAEIAADEDNRVRRVFEILHPDEQLRVVAFQTPGQFDRSLIGSYQKLIDLYVPPEHGESAAQRTAREDQFVTLVENGKVEDLEHMVRYLTDDQRAYLEETNPGMVERGLVSEAEGISNVVDKKIVPVVELVGQRAGMDEGTSEVLGNVVSDLGTIAANLRLGMYRTAEQAIQSGKYYAGAQLAGATGVEVFDGATKERIRERPGDTWDKAFARKDPLLGNMLVVPTANMGRRWAPAIIHGDFDKVVNGDPSTGLTGYREHPVLTFLEDATPFMVAGSVVSGGASLGVRFAAGAASTAARGALLASRAARAGAGRASKLADLGITSVRIGDDLVDVDHLARDLRSVSQNLDHEAEQHHTRAQNLNRYLDLLNPTDRLVDSLIHPAPRALDQVLPARAPRVVDQDLLDEVGFGSVDELTAHLRGDERFHVWGLGDNTFVRRAHGAENWVRGALGDEPYDPTTLTVAELKKDIDPTPKPGETPAQAMARVQAAEAEYWPRAEAAYRALPDVPPTINIRVNDAEHPCVAHTLERHGPQVPLRRFDAPDENAGTLQGRIYGHAPWNKKASFSYRWFDRSLINDIINQYLRDNWESVRLDLALYDRHEVTASHEHAVGEGFRNRNYHKKGPRKAIYSQTSLYTITLDLLHSGRGPPVVRVVRAFPNGRGFMEEESD